jgi:hypothetical protein
VNLFDGLERAAFSTVTATMGYPATWQPSAGGPVLSAPVLFKDASKTAQLLDISYDPRKAMIEYFIDYFPGLKASVNNKVDELIIVNGIGYGVDEVTAKDDGKTLVAKLMQI